MHVLKDIRSFTYKLTPVFNDKNFISLLTEHSQKKALQNESFLQFKSSHAHEYIGLEHRLVQDPNLIVPFSKDQNISRIYLQKIKRALNLLYKQKNKLTDAIYHVTRRIKYFRQVTEIPKERIEQLLHYSQENWESIQDVMIFININAIGTASLPSIDTSLFLSKKLGTIIKQFRKILPDCKKFREMLNGRIWEIKQLQQDIKKNLKLERYPQQLRAFQENIRKKVNYNFFLNKWMANHFILENFDLNQIQNIKNGLRANSK